jgi:hypothetical protein
MTVLAAFLIALLVLACWRVILAAAAIAVVGNLIVGALTIVDQIGAGGVVSAVAGPTATRAQESEAPAARPAPWRLLGGGLRTPGPGSAARSRPPARPRRSAPLIVASG